MAHVTWPRAQLLGQRPTSPDPRPKQLDGSISLKLLLETRLQSEFFDTLDNLILPSKKFNRISKNIFSPNYKVAIFF